MDSERVSLATLVDPQHTAILVVDVQPMFTAMPLSPPVSEVLPRIQRFLDMARSVGVLRIRIRHVIPEERWTDVWQDQHPAPVKTALAPDSPVSGFAPGFDPEAGDLVIVKER